MFCSSPPAHVPGRLFQQTLKGIYDDQVRELLTEEWGAVKGYLRIDKGKIDWYYDTEDPEEAFIVDRLKQVYLSDGFQWQAAGMVRKYKDEIGFDSPSEIRAALKSQKQNWTRTQQTGRSVHGPVGAVRRRQPQDFLRGAGAFAGRERHHCGAVYVALFCDAAADDHQQQFPRVVHGAAGLDSGGRRGPYGATNTGANLTAQIPSRGADDELDRLIDSFNRMIERLNSSFTQTRQFSTDVSHELRTPLTAIRGQLEVALLTAKTIDEYKDAMVDALQDVERLSQTIRALLLLSQAESGQLAIQWNVLDLAPIAADIVDQFQIPAEGAHLTLTSTFPPNA